MTQSSFEPSEQTAVNAEQRTVGRPPAAAMVRMALANAGVLCVRIIGSPGSGKTELVVETLKRLPIPRRIAVIAVNPASARDANRLRDHCGHVAHIEARVPDATGIWSVISKLRLTDFDIVFVEGSSGMEPLEDVGQDATAAVFAVSAGDDKAAEYRMLLSSSSVVLLTKIDIRTAVKFDERVFHADVQFANSDIPVFALSAVTGAGMHGWLDWLNKTLAAKKRRNAPSNASEQMSERFFG